MSWKQHVRISTIVVSFIVSIMIILLLPIFLNFAPTPVSLGKTILNLNGGETHTANVVTFRGKPTLGGLTPLGGGYHSSSLFHYLALAWGWRGLFANKV